MGHPRRFLATIRAWLNARPPERLTAPSCTHYVYDAAGQRAYAPHCDDSVLHAPGECVYCDHYPDWQAYRRLARIAFTGQAAGGDEDLAPCPSDYRRGQAGAHVWGGNQPLPPGAV